MGLLTWGIYRLRKKIADLGDIQIGFQLRGRLETTGSGHCYVIQIKDVDEEKGLLSASLDSFDPGRNISRYLVQNNDVLFLSRGKRNFAVTARGLQPGHPTVALSYFYIVRAHNENVLPDFLSWIINDSAAQDYLRTVSTGTGIPFVSKESFENLEISLPSIATQESLVHLTGIWKREKELRMELVKRREQLVSAACRQLLTREGIHNV